ncbi:porin [Psychrobacter namhaensis]|uniref:porin n=1 Tax=Psychrobacter namhaensis TaxID=292734 RepID=UPI003D0362C0
MKKLLLATAIAALSVSAANAAPTVYGKAFLAADYVNAEFDGPAGNMYDEDTIEINSHSSRIGFKGSEAMTANTDVIYQLEYGTSIDGDSNGFKNRDTFLGVNNKQFGEFRVGRNQSSLDRINNVATADGGYWNYLGSKASKDNMVESGRIDNSMIWTAPKYQGLPLQLSAMYAADEDDNSGDGFGVAAMFDQGTGFTAGVAYDKDLNLGNNYVATGDIIRGTATVDLSKFAAVPVTLGALYQVADIDNTDKKEKGFVVSAAMGLQNFAKPATVYAQYNNTSNLRGLDGIDTDQIVVGGKYFYQPNMIMHAYAGQNDNDLNDKETLAIGTGLEYKF